MKNSKLLKINWWKLSIYSLSVIIFIFTSCGQNKTNQPEDGFTYDSYENQDMDYDENYNQERIKNNEYSGNVAYLTKDEYRNEMQQSGNSENQNKTTYKYYSIMSQDFGIPFGTLIIPSSWHESNNTADGLLFEGPDNIKIFKSQSASHYYSNDYNLNQYQIQMGNSVAPPKSVDQIVSEDLAQLMQNQGFRFKSKSPLPEIAALDTRLDSYLFKATPEQKQYYCLLTEWEDQKGNPAMVIVRFFECYYQVGGMDWGYTVNAMSANKNVYKRTKQAYVYSLINFWINPQWVQANNNYWSNVNQQQTAAHNQRMADIKAQGQAILERGRMHSEMLDSNHEQFMNNLRSDGGHSQFIDYIRDETNVTSNGQTYKVESGSNYYWMNNNGEYIKTDNAIWNPNTDPTFNNQDWNQANIDK